MDNIQFRKSIKTVIMAGGKGTRIASVAADVPKPMIKLHGKPILEYQLECLKQYGLSDIIMVVGHLGNVIQDYFGDGKKFGCAISYYCETEPLGSAGALYKIADQLSDDFLLINGDIIFDIDFARFIKAHQTKEAWATLAAHPNNHPFDSSLLLTDAEDRVVEWIGKEDPRLYYKNLVNAGIHIITKKLLAISSQSGGGYQSAKIDLDRDVLKPNLGCRKIFAYKTPEYIKDMGTPDRYAQVLDDIQNGYVKRRNLSVKQKAIFLDRDGTINQTNGFVHTAEDLALIDGAAQAIQKINRLGYLAIVITNQPVIARGGCTLEELNRIHAKMESDLGKEGAYLDDIYFCPHHPDKGFEGERPEYKIDCDCRKPKPGMILQAAKKYNIDLSQSYMVGDSFRDYGAGLAAGCKAAFLSDKTKSQIKESHPDFPEEVCVYKSLADFAATL